jgi:hypothetical protein
MFRSVAGMTTSPGASFTSLPMDKRRYSDRREYLIDAVKKRRRKVREMAVEYKGGKCSRCGYARCLEALEFHHLDSSKKDFGISDKGYTRSWNKIREEIDKCVLVCANCHRELHAHVQISSIVSGIPSGPSEQSTNVMPASFET